MGTTDRNGRGVLLTTFALYLATFVVFAFPWLRQMRDVMPSYPFRQDEEFIVWALAWVTHALVDLDARVFDANIFHPAPDQLTGSEYLFSFQPLFAPLYLLTGEPLLATGIVTFLTYPLAGCAMAALLIKMGCSPLVAWLSGLTYALGILRVPLNFHTLQYPNLFLPLVALSVVSLRSAPGVRNAVWLFLSLLATFLTSFYIAVLTCIALSLWILGEILVSRRGIPAFLTAVAFLLLGAMLVAALVLSPYTTRSQAMLPDLLPWDHSENLGGWVWLAFTYWGINCDWWRVAFVPLVLLSLGARCDAWRRGAIIGGVLGMVSTMLVTFGLPEGVSQVAAQTPLRNFRGWVRLLLIADFGVCILAAIGLDLCRRRLGTRVAWLPIAAFALLAAFPRLTNLASGMTAYPAARGETASAYRTVKHYADERGRGPLLELPIGASDRESMFGSTFHWLPLVSGLSGYLPSHARTMYAAIAALPAPLALRELVDLTHVRWILVRPDQDWPGRQLAETMRVGLARSGLVGPALSFGGFTLFQVTASPRRTQWYAAIAAGPRPGLTALGTPIRRLSPGEAVASVQALGEVSDSARSGAIRLRLAVRNRGTADWPVLGNFAREPPPLTVYLQARLARLSQSTQGEESEVVHDLPLDRDVHAGETVMQLVSVPRPVDSGRYRIDISVAQKDGPKMTEPPSRMFHQVIELTAEADQEEKMNETAPGFL